MLATDNKNYEINTKVHSKTQPKVLHNLAEVFKAIESKQEFVFEKFWSRKSKEEYSIFNYEQPLIILRNFFGETYKFSNLNAKDNVSKNIIKEVGKRFFNIQLTDDVMNETINSFKLQNKHILNSPLPFTQEKHN